MWHPNPGGQIGLRWCYGAILLAVLATPEVALSLTDEERAGARAAANAGGDAFDAGRWQDAITYFKKAEALVHAPPHLLFIARSYEKLGRLVAARENYLKIVRESLPADAPQAFRDAQSAARQELPQVEKRVPFVSVAVQGAGELPVTVKMNGESVPEALVGVPRPLDPGTYEFQAFAQDGSESTASAVKLTEGAKETVVLTLRPREPGAADPAASPAGVGTTTEPTQDEPALSGGSSPGLRIGSYAAFGVGAVGLGLGLGFGLKAKSKRDEANEICSLPGPNACPAGSEATVNQLDSDGDSAATIATVGFVVGGVGVATGVTLLVLSLTGNKPSESGARNVQPWIGWRTAGVAGRF